MARRMPEASPGIAASQNNWVGVSLKPILGKRTTSALTTNQTMKAIIRFRVVMVNVFQARLLPVASQNPGSSGVQVLNQARGLCSVISKMLRRGKGIFLCPFLFGGEEKHQHGTSASLREYHRQVTSTQLR